MPLYEYECESCHRRTEVIQRFGDDPKTECSHCGGDLRKLLSAPMVQFKGSGWYVTDYGAKKPASERSTQNGSGGDKASEGGKTSGGKSESAKSEKKSPAAAKSAASPAD